MGVDIMLGPDEYNPCHAQVDTQDPNVIYNDRFYAACQDSNLGRSSYYRHVTYTGGGPQLGAVVFGGADHNHCGGQGWCTNTDGIVMHGWSDKATAWALEFYPGANEGGVRITGRFDQRTLGNFASSGPLGAMRPITDAIPGSFRLAGSVAGGPWPDRRFEVAAFQMPPWTMVTSAYYPEQGFAVLVNSGSPRCRAGRCSPAPTRSTWSTTPPAPPPSCSGTSGRARASTSCPDGPASAWPAASTRTPSSRSAEDRALKAQGEGADGARWATVPAPPPVTSGHARPRP